ncbi:MAG TPA: hypothetical protein VN937_07020 [Blastocatellia bacterium]|nr:hypothetical protein [Blastocatellia bacterium]
MRGTVNQLNRIVSDSVRHSIWQLIALLITLFVAIAGGLAYLTTSIDNPFPRVLVTVLKNPLALSGEVNFSERRLARVWKRFRTQMPPF